MRNCQRIAWILLLFMSIGLMSSCIGSKKGRCKECPEFTKAPVNDADAQALLLENS